MPLLAKTSDLPSGLPTFRCYVLVPLTQTESYWADFFIDAVSASDACLQAGYAAVRKGFIRRGESVRVCAETSQQSCWRNHRWVRAERLVTPAGRTGGVS